MSCVLVDGVTNVVRTFSNTENVTIGRNPLSSIDIPQQCISRNQCVIKSKDGEWAITDLSTHKTTLVNNKPIPGETVLKTGDKISFQNYNGASFNFFEESNYIPSHLRKRKPDEDLTKTPSKKLCEYENGFDSLTATVKKASESEEDVRNSLTPPVNNPLREEYETALSEAKRFKDLYEKTQSDFEIEKTLRAKVLVDLKKAKEELEEATISKTSQIALLEYENNILKTELGKKQEVNEKMILEIQNLLETLKESELEQIRLYEELKCSHCKDGSQSEKKDEETGNDISIKTENGGVLSSEEQKNDSQIKEKLCDKCSKNDNDEDIFAIQKIVDLVEVNWNKTEVEHIKEELKKKNEELTDLALKVEKRSEELMEAVDRELICSICSEVLCDAVTLNCKHTFCKVCVCEWKTKKRDCPVCRTKIKFEIHPLVLDSFIDKFFDVLGGEIQKRRTELKSERNQNKRTPSHNNRSGRRGIRNRNPRHRGDDMTLTAAMNIMQPQVIIDLMEVTDALGFHPVARRRSSSRTTYIDLTGPAPMEPEIIPSRRRSRNVV